MGDRTQGARAEELEITQMKLRHFEIDFRQVVSGNFELSQPYSSVKVYMALLGHMRIIPFQ